jgi:hypothetical protein
MLIGRQERTASGYFIKLLAVARDGRWFSSSLSAPAPHAPSPQGGARP